MCALGPRDPTKLYLGVSCGGTGQQWTATGAAALGAADLGMAYTLLEEVAINPTIEPPEQTLGEHKQTLCAPGPRRKEQ